MKRVIALIMVFCLIFGFAFGQDKDKTWQTRDFIGLVFQFQGFDDLDLENYWGGIGAKVCFGSIAFRPGIVFGSTSTDWPPALPADIGDKRSISQFGGGADFLLQIATGRVAPYIGIGGAYRSGKTTFEDEYSSTLQTAPDITETTMTVLGFSAIIGVELFIFKNVALGGEYRIGYMSGKTKEVYTDVLTPALNYTEETTNTSLGITTMGNVFIVFYIK